MTKKRKNIIFGILAFLFILTAVGAVFYSLGWRFDWKTKKLMQPGMFYLKATQKSCEATIAPVDENGNTEASSITKKTDFLSGSTMFENLNPQKYKIQIKKSGYIAWEKTLEIKEKEATEAKNICLIPENPIFTAISGSTEEFYISPDNKKIITKETEDNGSNGKSPSGSRWSLKLFEPEKNIKSSLIKESDISISGTELNSVIFSPDSKKILIKTIARENQEYYLLDLDKNPVNPTLLGFIDSSTDKVYFNPSDPQKLLVLSASSEESGTGEKTISQADLTDNKLSSPLIKNIVTCQPSKSTIYCLDSQGFLNKSGFNFEKIDKINLIPYPINQNKIYSILTNGEKITLWEENTPYLLDEKTQSFQKISDSAEMAQFSSDGKKLAFSDGYEMKILFLKKTDDKPGREAGDQIFIARYSEKIKNIFWYTDNYLIFTSGDKIKIAEIDDRDKINIVDLPANIAVDSGKTFNPKSPEIFWSQLQKKLFILSENSFYTSEKLIP
jgi:hypothetical protein